MKEEVRGEDQIDDEDADHQKDVEHDYQEEISM